MKTRTKLLKENSQVRRTRSETPNLQLQIPKPQKFPISENPNKKTRIKNAAQSATVAGCFKRGSFHDPNHHENADEPSSSHCLDTENELPCENDQKKRRGKEPPLLRNTNPDRNKKNETSSFALQKTRNQSQRTRQRTTPLSL
ncbi:hypothetical protein V8G54_010982 [Vigna mungo]|uniref:Uncharacterized protein n=1 Tax=Vigna mungo TaxID=3915 RepID=A0AAQ3NR27_VIGMU